jgi:uncharacterized membrane protein
LIQLAESLSPFERFCMAQIRKGLPSLSALTWLRDGFRDMQATRFSGAFYGLVFAAIGALIAFVYATFWKASMGMTAGFFLMGPIICTGIYELSRQLQRGEAISLVKSMGAWRRNWKSLGFFAVILTFLLIVWARVSVVLFALFANHDYPDMQSMITQIVSLRNIEFILVWLGVSLPPSRLRSPLFLCPCCWTGPLTRWKPSSPVRKRSGKTLRPVSFGPCWWWP